MKHIKMKSPLGTLTLVASTKGLRAIILKADKNHDIGECDENCKILSKAKIQLEQYFQGKREEFDLPLDMVGTDFQKRTWLGLLNIPYGKTVSYKELASMIKAKNGARAVGMANGRNPLAIIVPCHRVIGANGSLTGYAGGLKAKKALLNLEGLSI